jgi:hypothetical protein
MNKYKQIISIALPFLLLVTSMPAQAQQSDICEQWKGAGKAYGICVAATHGVGCSESDQSASPTACARLEAQFQEATDGEQPPWLVPTCPEAPFYRIVIDDALERGPGHFVASSCIVDLTGPQLSMSWLEVTDYADSRNLINIDAHGGGFGPRYTFGSLVTQINFEHNQTIEDPSQEIALACMQEILDLADELTAAGFSIDCEIY